MGRNMSSDLTNQDPEADLASAFVHPCSNRMLIIQNSSPVYSSGALSSREAPPTNGLERLELTVSLYWLPQNITRRSYCVRPATLRVTAVTLLG